MALPDFSDLIPELICIGIDVAICGILYKVYTVNNGSIRAVKVTLVYVLEKSQFLIYEKEGKVET